MNFLPLILETVLMIVLKRILVATDFGEAAGAALQYGRELARMFGARLDVVHVADNVMARAFGADGFTVDYSAMQRDLEAAERRQLEALIDLEDGSIVKAKPVLLISSSPAVAIAEYAEESQADLIVMGTHGRNGGYTAYPDTSTGNRYTVFPAVTYSVFRWGPPKATFVRRSSAMGMRPSSLPCGEIT